MGNYCCQPTNEKDQQIFIEVSNNNNSKVKSKQKQFDPPVLQEKDSYEQSMQREQAGSNIRNPHLQQITQPLVSAQVKTLLNQFYKDDNRNSSTSQIKSKYIKIGQKVYKGQLNQYGRPQGFGKLYYPQGSVLVSNFENGLANGMCHYFWPDGSYFQGRVQKNVAVDDNAVFNSKDISYKGSIKNNNFQGKGILKGQNNMFEFIGQFAKGKMKQGKLTWKQPQKTVLPLSSSQVQYLADYLYEGKFDENQNFTGKGKLVSPKGQYIGDFYNGVKNGKGAFQYTSGIRYEGDYKNDVREGRGTIIGKNKSIAFEGQFKNGLPNGKGKAPGPDGVLCQVQWRDGISSQIQQSSNHVNPLNKQSPVPY